MASSKVESNMFLVNAPAGSGKTHFIKDKINNILDKDSSARILCITYTERAAKQLQDRILSKEVFISTIHSFINSFISPFYSHLEAIDLYYELYKKDVEDRILEGNELDYDDPNNRNSKYLVDNGLMADIDLSIEIIKENTKSIYYNERSYNTLYYGGLSHDNLLEYGFALLERYPILQFRLREMFQYIFVDEVQDTDAKILRIFYNAVKDTSTELYYFGDKMQEIYENYGGGFEEEYKIFDSSISKKFKYNYRSSGEIVEVLNNLYGRIGSDKQKSKKGDNGLIPRLIICENIESYYTESKSNFDGFLTLRIANRARFARTDSSETMENVYNAISRIYPNGSRIKVIDVMLPQFDEQSPDPLVNFFYNFGKLKVYFESKHYAKVIELLGSQIFIALNGVKRRIFDSTMKVSEHADKARLHKTLSKAFEEYSKDSSCSLKEFLVYLVEQNIIIDDFMRLISNTEDDEGKSVYEELLAIKLSEMKKLIYYKDNQSISTQHGVKGEGHSKVCFWSEDSKRYRPYVYMYDFFEMYTLLKDLNLETFQSFYYLFKYDIDKLEHNLGIEVNKLKSADLTDDKYDWFNQTIKKYEDNIYFNSIYQEHLEDYKTKQINGKNPTLKSIQAIFKPDIVNRILVAYKLFYVGCSRAIDELVVLVDQEKISLFEDKFKIKMKSIGFEIISVKKET